MYFLKIENLINRPYALILLVLVGLIRLPVSAKIIFSRPHASRTYFSRRHRRRSILASRATADLDHATRHLGKLLTGGNLKFGSLQGVSGGFRLLA